MKYNIIVSTCKNNNGIGLDGIMPWNITEVFNYLSTLTKGNGKNAVVMGGNTYRGLKGTGIKGIGIKGIGLIGRDNLILSSSLSLNFTLPSCSNIVKSFTDIYSIIYECYANNYDSVWIIGGASIYRQFLNFKYLDEYLINKCYVTKIHKLFECDVTFPHLSVYDWTITKCDEITSSTDNDNGNDNGNGLRIDFIEYSRIP